MLMAETHQDTGTTAQTTVDETVAEHVAIKHNLTEFLSSVVHPNSGFSKPDVFSLVFSPLALPGYQSGGSLWRDVTMHDRHYYIPEDEAEIFRLHRGYLQQLFADRPTVYEIGPGDVLTLARKTMQIVDAVDAKRYIALDVNKEFASKAAQHVSINKPDVSTSFVCGDYNTMHHKFDNDGKTSLGLFLGCSASQYRLSDEEREGSVTFKSVLKNFGNMMGYNTLLILTTDANPSASSATECYSGGQVRAFLNNWLQTVMAHLATDPEPENNYVLINGKPYIDPKNPPVLANSRYEDFSSPRKGGRVVHSLVVLQPLTIVIDGKKFDIDPGTQLDIGSSEKWALNTIKSEIKRTDEWATIKTLSAGRSVSALVIAGKDVPDTQIARAKKQVSEWSSNGGAATAVFRNTTALLQQRMRGAEMTALTA